VVPEQASEVPAERAKLGHESGCLREQGNGGCATITSHQAIAPAAARRGEQRGITAERDHQHPGGGAVSLQRLLEDDADAALRGANCRD